jgi:hypothetical protein
MPITFFAPNSDAAIANIPLPQPISRKELPLILSDPIRCSNDSSAVSNLSASSDFLENAFQFSPKLKAIFFFSPIIFTRK